MPGSTAYDKAESPQNPPHSPSNQTKLEIEENAPEADTQITQPASDESIENPPLPPGPPPEDDPDDGWQPVWDATYGRYYFYNAITNETTWTNPRVAEDTPDVIVPQEAAQLAVGDSAELAHDPLRYNPAIHGDYDPTAPYAQPQEEVATQLPEYTTVAAFNRFTGKFQSAQSHQVPENYNDENKSRRQMEVYFDVDAAANSHEGRSLKAERQTKKLSKKELKQFKEKRKKRKEEKRKAWLKD